ncbi:transcriptional regulator [Streptomyces noursei ATCC 11455]|uniref:helix-turn-helix transcriptional regulator n=1 Tax=Streptomyces noursei TaxID=1971 RepID=UPI00081D0AA5|nr:transcriptional regulator [Streptomyces noursei ATCC 11455]
MQGRDEELRRIELLLADARCGESGALLLHGEAGIGKTALLEHAAARAQGLRVLRVEGIESEMELGFSGLHQLFLPVLQVLDRLPAPQAQALRSVSGLVDAPVRDRLTVALAEAAADTPLLCLVDDLQWLDQPSVDVLAFAARRLRAEGVAMLFAARGDLPGSAARALPRLHISGIDRTAAAALLPGLAPHVAERIIDQAQGNPLALRELSAALTPAQRSGQLGPLALPEAPPALPSHLQEALAEQVRRLPEATRRILAVAAADDTGDLAAVLAAAARSGGSADDLAPAERAGLLTVSGSRLRFRHPLVRFAACRHAPLAERIAAHRALARTLDGTGHAQALAACADALRQPAVGARSRRFRALTGPDPRAEEHYRAALDLHPADDSFERARTELLYGEWLRSRRRKLDARDRLRAAPERFDRVGAQPWARRVRTELRAAGEHHDPTLAADSPIARLSPQEREVVRLAATNREIATQLLLSPRTVGHHLYRAFPELGIGSRTQLADILAE